MKDFLRKYQVFFTVFAIFFLTGCATGRYHSSSAQGVSMGSVPADRLAGFQWPVRGAVTSSFGSRQDGVSLKGIVVRSTEGNAVLAARAGKVVFVDDNMPGYGKTVIVEHDPVYSTVYARNAQILVSLGQIVAQGQTIAKSGSSGKGGTPQLYFEIRRNSKAEDPQTYLMGR